MSTFNGLGTHLGNLARLAEADSRSISPENFDGARGGGARASDGTGAEAARDLGVGRKISPSVRIEPGQTFSLADIAGSGAIQQIWMTPTGHWRHLVLRCYWEDQDIPSGRLVNLSLIVIQQIPNIPTCFPANRPRAIPRGTLWNTCSTVTLVKFIPALAKANTGNTKKATTEGRSCSKDFNGE